MSKNDVLSKNDVVRGAGPQRTMGAAHIYYLWFERTGERGRSEAEHWPDSFAIRLTAAAPIIADEAPSLGISG